MVGMGSHGGLLALVAFAAAFSLASGGLAVMSIDLGSEYMKIAIVKPGVPMEIALNKESNRKTPTIVAFRDGERHFASQAENTALKFPHKSVGYLMQIVGRQFDDPQVKLYRERFPHYTLVKDEERGTVLFKIDEDTVYSVEELLAMILEKAKEYAKDFAEQEINDAVITVPPFFNQAERRAVIAAAKMVGINVLQLIGDNAAVALNYGVFRRKNFNATTQYYMFYDMGSTSTTATIVGYNVVKSKEKVHSESNPQLTVKGVGFDRTLGGLEFTLRLRTHLAKAFNDEKKTTLKVDENDRAMAKLLKESERVKKVLSANVDHHAQIENLIDEKDMRIPVSRAELEEMTSDLTDRVTRPIEEALKISEITLPEITEVILMGGGTRMPKVQEILMKYLGRTELGKSINTDEAAALGAVYQAAFLGKGFKVKKFAVREGNIYPINVEFERQKSDAEGEDLPKTIKRTLFGRMNPYPQKKVMTFNKHTKDFSFNVVYSGLDFLTESDKQSFGSPLISKYSLEGVENALSKNKDTAEARGIKAHFQMDGSGILSLDNVELVFEKNDSADTTVKSAWSKIGSAIGGLFGSGSDDEPKVEEQPSDTPSAGEGEDSPTADGADSDAAATAAAEDEKKEDEDSTKKDDQSSPDDESETGADSQKEDIEGKKEEADQKEEEEKAGKTGKEDKPKEDEKKESSDKTDKAGNTPSKEDEKVVKEKDGQDKAPKIVNIKEIIKAVPEVLDVKDMSEERFKASKKRLSDLRKFDQAKVELEQAKNELEAFIFDFQDKLTQGSHEKCSTPEEREALSTLLSETSDWLYEQTDETKKSDYKEKLRVLRDKTLAISKRVFELEERPKALAALKDALNQSEFFLAAAKNLSGVEDPIFTQVEIETLEKLINETKQWRDDTVAAQKKLQPYENPVLQVEDVGQKIYGLDREKRYLLNKLKNYRPKAKPKDENITKTDANDTTAEATPDQEDIPPFDDTDKTEDDDDDDDVKEDTESKEEEDMTEDKKSKKKDKAEEPKPKKKDKKEDTKDDTKPKKKDKTEDTGSDKDKQKPDKTSSGKQRPKSKRKEEDRDTEEDVLELDSEDTGKSKKSKTGSKKSSHSEL